MGVKWINKVEAEGTATMFPNYLMANREFVDKFDDKYSALVGLDDDTDQIVLKPLSKDEDEDPKYQDSLRIKINIQKSYIRFGNTKSMSLIASLLHVDVPKTGLKGRSFWNEKEDALFIILGGNK